MPKARASVKGGGAASALIRALRFETAGRKFYAAAASKSADPFARQVFELLARMEEQHAIDIRAIALKLEEEGKFPPVSSAPFDARMRVFERERSRIRKATIVTGDAATAMRKALGLEAEGREMYQRIAKAAAHPRERKFFALLAAEENGHFAVIYEYLDFLEAQGLRMGE